MRRLVQIGVVLASIAVSSAIAIADDEMKDLPQQVRDQALKLGAEAREHFVTGYRAFIAKDYKTASAEFELAYKASPEVPLLFTWAQSERLGGKCPHAIELYEKYLYSDINAEQADYTRRWIKECGGSSTGSGHGSGSTTTGGGASGGATGAGGHGTSSAGTSGGATGSGGAHGTGGGGTTSGATGGAHGTTGGATGAGGAHGSTGGAHGITGGAHGTAGATGDAAVGGTRANGGGTTGNGGTTTGLAGGASGSDVDHPPTSGYVFYTDYLGDALVVSGVIGLVTGVVYYAKSRSDADAADSTKNPNLHLDQYKLLAKSATDEQHVATFATIAGGVLAAAGIGVYIYHSKTHEHVTVMTDGTSVSVATKF